jgi:serine protease Do
MTRWSLAFVSLLVGALAGSFLIQPLLQGQPAGSTPAATAIPRELTSYHPVVEKVLPALVSIETLPQARKIKRNSRVRPRFDSPRIPEEFRKFFKDFDEFDQTPEDSTPSRSFGSGFVVDPKGVVMTNYHVVAGADQVEVTLRDGTKYLSTHIAGDRKTDIAIVRIDPKGKSLPYLTLGDSEAMQIGDRVLAFGAPFGLTGTVTAGIVSAKGRNGLHMNMYEDFLQTDAAINPGNSGGPLVNLAGQVIGINAAIKTRTGGFQGVGLAVASNLAKNVMNSLEKYGKVHRGYLGVQIKDLSKDVAERLGLPNTHGVLVARVFPDSPAGKAGIQAGDVITQIEGKPVKDGRVLQTLVAGLPLNKPVSLTVFRDGHHQTASVTVKEQPEQFGTDQESNGTPAPQEEPSQINLEKFGFQVTDLTPETASDLGYKKSARGAVVVSVEPGSPAAAIGLRKGTLITHVDKKPVHSARALRDALKKASSEKGALLQVQTPQGGTDFVVLKPQTVK